MFRMIFMRRADAPSRDASDPRADEAADVASKVRDDSDERPEDHHHAHFNTGPVGEFLVDDVSSARAELESRGVEFLGETHTWGDYVWAHFKAPDDKIYGITSGPYGPDKP